MEDIPSRQLHYEKQILFHLLILRKAMEQYQLWGEESVASPLFLNYPQFHEGMEQLIQVIKTCGKRFQEIPEAPEGIIDADRRIRKMGEELEQYSEVLLALFQNSVPTERRRIFNQTATLSLEIKKGYHQFVTAYELKYPGRLIRALRSFQDGEIIN